MVEGALSLFVLANLSGAAPPPQARVRPVAAGDARLPGRDDLAGGGRRTWGQLPRNLGRSFAGVFGRDNPTSSRARRSAT